MKLGLFGLNGIGISMTKVPEALSGDWSASVRASKVADQVGIEALVPYARWKGYVEEEPEHRSGIALDCYTWAAATGQATTQSAVFTTSHVPTIHPILAAKQCATIDHISGGRLALNVVAGWNRPELEMFGAAMREHDDRYAQAGEWIELLRRLWTEDEAFDHEGSYYRVSKAISLPKPVQHPFPPIMNAGGSDRGREFAAKYADIAFVIVKADDEASIRAEVDAYRKLAREEYGRDIQVWTFSYVVQRPTEKEARDYLHYYAEENGDDRSLEGWMRLQGMNTKLMPPEVMESLRFRFKAGNGGFELVGTPEQITDRIAMLSRAGIDGVLLSWVDYDDGLSRWSDGVAPLLVQAGLRKA
ncbi:MAG TPA: LLM class flavin-dependent oxidoreductase [Sphingobium sp.]|uniref:LLM class flavin-dependent oxidoreductase n=1 Tax=Sphingobium sp. TaxID=1912891 RepID=UPI002ED1FAAE